MISDQRSTGVPQRIHMQKREDLSLPLGYMDCGFTETLVEPPC